METVNVIFEDHKLGCLVKLFNVSNQSVTISPNIHTHTGLLYPEPISQSRVLASRLSPSEVVEVGVGVGRGQA